MPKVSQLAAQSPATVSALKSVLDLSPSLGKTVVLLGDSYEHANGPNVSGTATDFGCTYFTVGNTLLGSPFRIVANLGVGGETCAQIAARVQSAIAYAPDRIIVGGSTNDDLQTESAVSVALAAMYGCFDAIRDAGIALTVCTRPSKDSHTASQVAGQHAYNAGIREYAQRYRCELFDMAAAVCHPNTGKALAAGQYGVLANLMDTDGTHLSRTGSMVAGYAFYMAHLPVVQGNTLWTLATGGDTTQTDLVYDATIGAHSRGNIIKNGKLLGTTGTVAAPFTGSMATGWGVNSGGSVPATGGSGAVSKVAINGPVSRGEWQQIQINPGASGQTGVCEVFAQSPVTVFDGTRGLSIGDTIFGTVRFETDAANWGGTDGQSPSLPFLIVRCFNGSFSTLAQARVMPGSASNPKHRMASGVLRTPEFTIPAGTTMVFAYFRFEGVGTVRFTDLQVRKST